MKMVMNMLMVCCDGRSVEKFGEKHVKRQSLWKSDRCAVETRG